MVALNLPSSKKAKIQTKQEQQQEQQQERSVSSSLLNSRPTDRATNRPPAGSQCLLHLFFFFYSKPLSSKN